MSAPGMDSIAPSSPSSSSIVTTATADVAAAAGLNSAAPDKPGPVYLALAVVVWYGLTVVYSVYNTAVLQVFPFPLTVLTAELGAGVLLILPAWMLGVVRTPSLRMSQVRLFSYMGFVCLCVFVCVRVVTWQRELLRRVLGMLVMLRIVLVVV